MQGMLSVVATSLFPLRRIPRCLFLPTKGLVIMLARVVDMAVGVTAVLVVREGVRGVSLVTRFAYKPHN